MFAPIGKARHRLLPNELRPRLHMIDFGNQHGHMSHRRFPISAAEVPDRPHGTFQIRLRLGHDLALQLHRLESGGDAVTAHGGSTGTDLNVPRG